MDMQNYTTIVYDPENYMGFIIPTSVIFIICMMLFVSFIAFIQYYYITNNEGYDEKQSLVITKNVAAIVEWCQKKNNAAFEYDENYEITWYLSKINNSYNTYTERDTLVITFPFNGIISEQCICESDDFENIINTLRLQCRKCVLVEEIVAQLISKLEKYMPIFDDTIEQSIRDYSVLSVEIPIKCLLDSALSDEYKA